MIAPIRNNTIPVIFLALISTLFANASMTKPLTSCPANIKINVLEIPSSGIDLDAKYIINAPKNPPISQIGFTVVTLEYLVRFPKKRLIKNIKVIPVIKLWSVAMLGVRYLPSCEFILDSMVVKTPAKIANRIKKMFIIAPHNYLMFHNYVEEGYYIQA